MKAIVNTFLWGITVSSLVFFGSGCSSQNTDLSKGKELIKSDKRRKEERAVEKFKLAVGAIQNNTRDSAEANYLLGFYDSQDFYDADKETEAYNAASISERGDHMYKAYSNSPKEYLEILIFETLRSQDPNIQDAARHALKKVHEYGNRQKLFKAIKKAITSKDNRDREDARTIYTAIGKDPRFTQETVKILMELLDHKRKETRLNVVKSLGEIGNEIAIEKLVKTINSGSEKRKKRREGPEVRRLAVEALGKIGGQAVEELVKIIQNKGSSMRVDAIQALEKLGDERAIAPLLNVLNEQGGREVAVSY